MKYLTFEICNKIEKVFVGKKCYDISRNESDNYYPKLFKKEYVYLVRGKVRWKYGEGSRLKKNC